MNRTKLILLAVTLLWAFASASAQKVTLNHQNVSLEKIFSDITRQTGYPVNYSRPTVDPERLTSIRVTDTDLSTALNQLFSGTNIVSEIRDGKVFLTGRTQESTDNRLYSLTGVVTDAQGALVGVAVVVKDSPRGIATGIDGGYSINVARGEVLQFSLIGYETLEVVYHGQTQLNVTMKESTQLVESVVVTALGIKRDEKALSYNVQQVKAEELTTVKDANFVNSLIGKVAGVQINSSSAGVGGAARVVIRGEKSIKGDNSALYVIDGIPMFNTTFGKSDGYFEGRSGSEGIADINPEDIESVNMLSGASAAALYGNIASNGVIMINTKKGNKDKTVVTVGSSAMFSSAYIMPEMQSTYGNSVGEFSSWGDKGTGKSYNPRKFFNTGSNIINSVTLSTGNARNQTYVSLSSTNAAGILPNNEYDRYNFSMRNTSTFCKEKLTLDLGGNFIIQHDQNMVSQGQYFNPLPALYLFPRGENFDDVRFYERYNEARSVNVQYWPYNDQGLSLQNPYWIMNRMNRTTDKKRYMFNASLKWEITDWVDVSGRIKIDNSNYIMEDKRYASTLTTFAGTNGFYMKSNRLDRNTYADVLLNIHKTFNDKFSLNAYVGASIRDQLYDVSGNEGDLADKANFFTIRNINYTTNYKAKAEYEHTQSQGLYASVDFGYKSMLYLTVTGRNDWESQLAFSDQASFFYPSVGLSAIVSQMVNLPSWFSFLKVRASWAKTGNSFAAYLSHPGYTYIEGSHSWATSTTYPALHLRPEDTKTWEIGLNAKFWNKLNFDISFYRSNTYNQTFDVTLSSGSGYSSTPIQTGNVQNQGIEMALGYNNKWGDFRWGSSLTYTLNESKIIELVGDAVNPQTGELIQKDELEVATLGYNGYGPRMILRKGGSMSDIYVDKHLKLDGNGAVWVDSQTGNLAVENYAAPRKIGQMAARYRMGWNNTFAYKGLELGTVFAARVGGLCVSNTQGILDYYGVSKASADARNANGVTVNTGKVDSKKYYQAIGSATGGLGEHYIYSATNVRLQELSLNYTLPKRWFRNKLNLTVGFVGKNLWMIYCKAPFDPELSPSTTSSFYQGVDYFMQPSLRNYGFNIKLQF